MHFLCTNRLLFLSILKAIADGCFATFVSIVLILILYHPDYNLCITDSCLTNTSDI